MAAIQTLRSLSGVHRLKSIQQAQALGRFFPDSTFPSIIPPPLLQSLCHARKILANRAKSSYLYTCASRDEFCLVGSLRVRNG
jgi:hypothetical protein